MKIPLCVPCIGKEEFRAVKKVLQSGWLTDGPKNSEFEEQFARYLGVKRAVTLNSCTSALQLALEALSIKEEVILPSFTFVASANAVVKAGAKPVFADIDYDTCTISPDDVVKKINSRTEAIMPVHFAGQACAMDKLIEIAQKYNLKIIEDSAEAIGATYKGRMTGTFGAGCFSFFPTKNITTGEGGMLTTNDDCLAERVRVLAGHGISKTAYKRQKEKEPWLREARLAGYNYRMSSILAAVGIEQLKKIDVLNKKRRENAEYLTKRINFEEIDLPIESKDCVHVYQMYTIKLKKGIERYPFIMNLRKKGVMASVHFAPPVHLQKYYKDFYRYKKGDLPVTEDVAERIVTLPMYPGLEKKQLDYMVKVIGKQLIQHVHRGGVQG